MTISHENVQLPMKTCLPIDWQNTKFLAHYDISEEESLSGIKPIGNRWAFDFTSSVPEKQYIETPYIPTDKGTIEFWVYPHRFYDFNSLFENTVNQDDWECWIYATGMLMFRVNNNTVSYTLPSIKQWYHVAITWDKLTGVVELYVDGALRQSTTETSWVTPQKLTIGGKQNVKTEAKVTEFRAWDRVLPIAEIQSLMYRHLSGKESGLMAYWKLDDGSGKIALDKTKKGNSGIIYGTETWSDGQSIYTLRQDGKFGGCVAVEEGTTNLFSGKSANPTLGGSTVTKINDYSYDVTTANQSVSGFNSPFLTNNGLTKTFSGIIKGIEGTKVCVQVHGNVKEVTLTGREDYFSFTGNSSTNPSLAVFTGYMNSPNQITSFSLSNLQLEEKTFATSFTTSIRENGSLIYPNPIQESKEFTISFWFKRTGKIGTYDSILSIQSLNGVDRDGVYFDIYSEILRSFVYSTSGQASVVTASNIDFSIWNHVCTVATQEKVELYVNGKLHSTVGSMPFSIKGVMTFAKRLSASHRGNFLYDELRIDSVARTEDEIASWYASQSPFFPRGIHKTYL